MLRRHIPEGGGIAVTIIDREHPHFGESGVMTGDMITFKFTGETMAKVKLSACAHGTDACYVGKGQVREL